MTGCRYLSQSPKPETQNPKPETPNPKPRTPNPKPKTPDLKPENPNPKTQNQNPKPKTATRNPEPETRNPKPESRSLKPGSYLNFRACISIPKTPCQGSERMQFQSRWLEFCNVNNYHSVCKFLVEIGRQVLKVQESEAPKPEIRITTPPRNS